MAAPKELARMFKVLSVEARIRIVQLLRRRALCVGAISARVGVSQGAVSQHLRILRDAGLVEADRRGYYIHYRIHSRTLAKWQAAMAPLLESLPGAGADGPQTKRDKPCVAKKRGVNSRRS